MRVREIVVEPLCPSDDTSYDGRRQKCTVRRRDLFVGVNANGCRWRRKTPALVKTALVEVETHRKTRKREPHNIGIMCLAEGVIKSFNFRRQKATTHSKVFRRGHIQLGKLSLARLEQGPKYQRVFEKQHFELNCKLTLSRKARGKVRYVYSALCGCNLPV